MLKISESLDTSSFPFIKMQGIGNDFVLLDNPAFLVTPENARAIAHRRLGIGCDQLLVLTPSVHADACLAIWNADGSPAEACGNGTRCVMGWLAKKNNVPPHTTVTLEAPSGLLNGCVTAQGEATVSQGIPVFSSPLPLDLSSWGLPKGWAVSLGNPHLVIVVEDVESICLEHLGPLLEHHPFFLNRTNVEFLQVHGEHIKVRVWERGAGETLGCGTGASAAAFIALAHQHVSGPSVSVLLAGGSLRITWQPHKPLLQSGPFEIVFEGVAFLQTSPV